MQVRVVAADSVSAVETLGAVGLVYDVRASDFSIPGGAIRVRLLDAPLPASIELGSDGLILGFRTTAEAVLFSETLRKAQGTAARLDMTMLD